MRFWRVVSSVLVVGAIFVARVEDTRATARPHGQAAPQPLEISRDTRLLVVAPHPDDELIGAAGLMQRVREAGGAVHVVYLTDGDAYRDGVKREDSRHRLSFADYRSYGRQRQKEARAALANLGLDNRAATFLSFPDSGLCKLIRTYWSERQRPYRSPYTRLNRPPASEELVPDTEYRGEDLTQELATIIGGFRPTLILVTRKEDQHADHCAAWYFVADALGDVRRVSPEFAPDLLTYVVHYYDWPFENDGPSLAPPPGLGSGVSGWIRLPLTRQQVAAKRAALKRYRTQQHAIGWFVNSFVRSNEVFSRPAPAASHVVLPLKRSPCCEQ
jgi:LmbE family N-acetylglucosaminyl deacetylase